MCSVHAGMVPRKEMMITQAEEEIRKIYRNTIIGLGVFVTVLLLCAFAYTFGSEANKPEWESPDIMLLIDYTDDGTRTVCLWAEQGDRGGLDCPAWLQEEPVWMKEGDEDE